MRPAPSIGFAESLLRIAFWVVLFLTAGAPPALGEDHPSLEVKIGQMLMVGFRGLEVDGDHPIVRDIRKHGLGGVLLFDYDVELKSPVRNIASPAQVGRLISSLQKEPATPLLVAVDQEGGRVSRLKEKHGFPPTVSARALGAGSPEGTRRAALAMARTLARLGFNLNLAPVVDLAVNPANPIIGALERSYGADPQAVVRHATAFIDAHHEAGVLCALKHFPGHGSSEADSHLGVTDITATWSPRELEPFARLIDAGKADAVMTAHVFHRGLDPQRPATLSVPVVTGLLRERLGYDGVVLSDDPQMKAIADRYGLRSVILDTLRAGVDILVFGNNLDYDPQIVSRAAGLIRDLVEKGEVEAGRIDASYRRIMRLKERLSQATGGEGEKQAG